ncbi:MAG TPA: dTDP-4-dehydrorhamnose reductase, partial [Geobacteraceae bacterium]|nr:dTDP-4-dehydrorhamnose reductase [Geobacteraceae bacterium]
MDGTNHVRLLQGILSKNVRGKTMILVVGAQGMLGREMLDMLGDEARGLNRDEMEITSFESVRRAVATLKPAVVINSIAYTDVDGSESNSELAFGVNGDGVKNLAAVTADIGAKLVHISSDYVFDGKKGSPYLEEDQVNPMSVYGKSKLAGEENARLNPDHLIIRTQWLYGRHGNNFVETMLRLAKEKEELGVVDDQVGSPTWTVDLCLAVKALLDRNCRGTYHAVNGGSCSWFDFAGAIFAEQGTTVRLKPITTTELGRPAPRPLFSVLDCGKLLTDT